MLRKTIRLCKNIVAEDYETDKAFRQQSYDAYNYLMKNFYKLNWTLYRGRLVYPDDRKTEVLEGIQFPLKFNDNPVVKIVLLVDNKSIGGNYSNKTNTIRLTTRVPNINYDSFSEESREILEEDRVLELSPFYEYFKKLRGVFVHEFTHFLDYQRTSEKINVGYPKDAEKASAKYFKHPAEFNAYYQDLISQFEKFLDQHSIFEQGKYLKSFDSMLSAEPFVWEMKNKYVEKTELGKRFKKRLVQFFQNKQKEVLSTLNKYDVESSINNEIRELESKRGLLNYYLENSKFLEGFLYNMTENYPNLKFLGTWYFSKQYREEYSEYNSLIQDAMNVVKEFYERVNSEQQD